MRVKIAAGLWGLASLTGSIVIPMIWPTIDHRLGIGILAACAVGIVVGGIILIPDAVAWVKARWHLQWPVVRRPPLRSDEQAPITGPPPPPRFYSRAERERLADLYGELSQILLINGADGGGKGAYFALATLGNVSA